MRNIIRCDICFKEESCINNRLPKGFIKIDGLDFCENCSKMYIKRCNKELRNLIKEKGRVSSPLPKKSMN